MIEKHNMLSVHQINMCQNQSTETILNLLINQIHEIWQNENHVISLLFLNITKIYNQMICDRMMYVLQIKKISKQLAEWIKAFIIDRILILMLSNIEIKKINIYKNFSKIYFIFNSLFILCCEIAESLQQYYWSAKYKYFCRWYHTADLQTNHKEKLLNSWKHT